MTNAEITGGGRRSRGWACRPTRSARAGRSYAHAARSPNRPARRSLRASLRTGGKMIPLRYRRPTAKRCTRRSWRYCDFRLDEPLHADVPALHPCARATPGFGCRPFFSAPASATSPASSPPERPRRSPRRLLGGDVVPDWSGGTRIATALHEFNRLWARRVLSQGAIVLLISDGLEREARIVLP